MSAQSNATGRALGLCALALGAFLTAVMIERFTGILASPSEIVLFLPLTSIVGGGPVFGSVSVLLGLAFWPVSGWLAWRWMRHGARLSLAAALGSWLLLGFAQPVERLGLLMSV
ncbi:MAG: hypothetical protein GQE15_15255 [Archangiaceae bacterium]|nr:hypothetical protein [Archangiaceae bacterium]